VRVGLLIYGSLDILTGGFLYDRLLVDYLRREGDEVEVISLPWRTYGRHLSDNVSAAFFQRLCRASCDVLIQDELNHPSVWWLNRRLKQRAGYPLVSIVHLLRSSEARPAWQNRFYRWVERRYLQTLDGLIFNSRTTGRQVEALIGPGCPSVVAYPGCDHVRPTLSPDAIAARAEQPGALRVLFIGNLIPRKGLHVLIEALAGLPQADWQLTVIGALDMDPAYVRRLRRQIDQVGARAQIRLLGALPHEHVVPHLASHQVLAVPSLYEPFGIVYVEALGFGQPVMATTVGAAHEIISHGREGFLVAPGDSPSLARHLSHLHADRRELVRMSLAARQRYHSCPTWDDSARRIRHFLSTLVKP